MPAPNAAIDAEWSLLLAASSVVPNEEKLDRFRFLLRQPIRWERLYTLADHHSAMPLLCRSLSNFGELVSGDEIRFLRQNYETNLRKALLLSRELIRIVEHLSAMRLEVMPYKGPALAEAIYGDIALRQAGDIDLLIRPQDLPEIRDAVRELAYTPRGPLSQRQERSYLESGYECAFDGATGPNLLELQWAILPHFYAVDFDMSALFQRASTIPVAGHPMRMLSIEDLFLVLSAHAAKHVWGRLIWLCDLARIMSLPDLNWNWIGTQARSLGMVRILRVTLLLAQRLLGARIPAPLEENLPKDAAASTLATQMQTYVANETLYDVESRAYFRLMMGLRERGADRLRFLRRLVFTPGPGEWSAVRLPQPLFPLYRVVRLSRLAARMVRA